MVGDDRKGNTAASFRVLSAEDAALETEAPGTKGANIPRKRNALGRGLSALMSASAVAVDFSPQSATQTAPQSAAPEASDPSQKSINKAPDAASAARETGMEGGLIYLSIDRVQPNKKQPRQHFVQADIDSLAASIRQTGLLQPIVVRRRSSEPSGQLATYEIVAGERRFRAAKQAGLVKIPALLRQLSDRETLELGIVENVQRADLNAIEEAAAYQRLATDFGASQAEIAEKVGKDRASIANALRLLKLPDSVQQLIVTGKISAGHGRAVLTLEDAAAQLRLVERIQQEALSVRGAEQLAGKWKREGEPAHSGLRIVPDRAESTATTAALEERLRRALGTKVKVTLSADGAGEMKISFFSSAELERILEKLES